MGEPGGPVVLGIGDDAAAWQPSRAHLSVVTSDALVDGVHFDRGFLDAESIGHRCAAANLSDLAAMGARPRLLTVTLGLGAGEDEPFVRDLYRGMQALCGPARAAIVGGDLVRSERCFVAITAVGEVARTRLKRRSGARAGDVVAVTGPLGASHAGLVAYRRGIAAPEAEAAFARPVPRLREGRWLAASAHVHAMMDVSDGLSTDLGRMALASGVGARVERIPIAAPAAAVASRVGESAGRYALHGGEDFELLVAIDRRAFRHLAERFRRHFGKPLEAVGRFVAGSGITLAAEDGERPLAPEGWDHFTAAAAFDPV